MSMPSVCRRFAAAFMVSATLAACQTLGGRGLVASAVTTEMSEEAAASIAAHMVGRFAEQTGPGNTTVLLTLDGSVFGQALERSLKGWGYAIATGQPTEGTATVPLAYIIDTYEGGLLVRLSTPSVEITRLYELSASGAEPSSPISVMERGSGAGS